MYFVHYDKPEQFSDPNKKREIYRAAAHQHRASRRAHRDPESFFPWRRKGASRSPRLSNVDLAKGSGSQGDPVERFAPEQIQPSASQKSKPLQRIRYILTNEKARKRSSTQRQPAGVQGTDQDQLTARFGISGASPPAKSKLPGNFHMRIKALTGKPWYVVKAIDYCEISLYA